MKKIHAEVKSAAVSSVAVLCFLAATAGVAFAQGGIRPAPVERRTELLNRQGEQYERETKSRDLKGLPEKPADRRRAQELAAQIKYDFEGLQVSHNQIVLVMAEKDGLNGKLNSVFQEVAEIKKYSTRLKSGLALPKPKEEETRVEANIEGIEASLMNLRKHIYNFVTNPLFESPGVLDVEQGRTASRDLDRIIELSESITKRADKQKKRG